MHSASHDSLNRGPVSVCDLGTPPTCSCLRRIRIDLMQLIRASPPSPVNFLLHGLYFFFVFFFFYRGILKPTHIVAEPMESADQCDQVRLLSECKAHDVLCEPISVWTRPVATTSTVPGMSGGRERHLFLILRRLAEPASVHLRVCLPQWSPLLSHPSPTPPSVFFFLGGGGVGGACPVSVADCPFINLCQFCKLTIRPATDPGCPSTHDLFVNLALVCSLVWLITVCRRSRTSKL